MSACCFPWNQKVAMEATASVESLQYENAKDLFRMTSHVQFEVITKSREKLSRKINALTSNGPSKLMIVSDFDYTLTKFWVEPGKRGASCHKVLDYSGFMPPEILERSQALHKKYYPIEIDPNISRKEKEEKLIEWWTKEHEEVVNSHFTKCKIRTSVAGALADNRLRFREHVDEFIRRAADNDVPMLVFSAGIQQVARYALDMLMVNLPDSVYVLSNVCIFEHSTTEDDDPLLIGFAEPCIHTLNKHSESFLSHPFFQSEDTTNRCSVILLGDNAGDAEMVRGMRYSEDALVRIGFLNDSVETRLEQYLETFDVVILGDPGLDVPLALLNQVLSTSRQ